MLLTDALRTPNAEPTEYQLELPWSWAGSLALRNEYLLIVQRHEVDLLVEALQHEAHGWRRSAWPKAA